MLRDPYTRPLLLAFLLQLLFLFFYKVMVLDLGQGLQACCYGSVAFWLGVVLILVRRPRNPSPGDLTYIRWGLIPIVLISNPIFLWVWKAKGVI
jgi:hypothetical protein